MRYALRTRNVGFVAALLLAVARDTNAAETPANDNAAAIAPYANDDTFLAARLDLAAMAKTKGGDDSPLFAILPFLGDEKQAVMPGLHWLDQLARDVAAAGVDSVYVVAGLADVNKQGGPLLVFQVRQGVSAKEVAAKLQLVLGKWSDEGQRMEMRVDGSNVVIVGRPWTLDRYATFVPGERVDLTGPLSKLSQDGAMLAIVFCLGPDFRRVVRELWPELPGALAPLRGELADNWRHVEIGFRGTPNALPRFALQASDVESAETFVKLWDSLPTVLESVNELGDQRYEMGKKLQPVINEIRPHIEGTRVTIDLDAAESQLPGLRNIVGDIVHTAMEPNRRHRRAHQFKEIVIAMLNYYDVNKHLPASASHDKNGKPLLSWRVTILPYIDEVALYKQFRLDEPWDSPHNRALIAKMPSVYADPDPKLRELARSGKTTYQVPVSSETIFHGNEGISFRDVIDGTSKTIAIAEVEPSRAAEWTKPQDWEVDLEKPLEGVARADRKVFTVAFADGSVHAIPVDADQSKLRGLLTRGGREVFDWP